MVPHKLEIYMPQKVEFYTLAKQEQAPLPEEY